MVLRFCVGNGGFRFLTAPPASPHLTVSALCLLQGAVPFVPAAAAGREGETIWPGAVPLQDSSG